MTFTETLILSKYFKILKMRNLIDSTIGKKLLFPLFDS